MKQIIYASLFGITAGLSFSACTVTHKIAPSAEPIKIDLNVKIDQEVRIRLDEEVEELISDNPDLF